MNKLSERKNRLIAFVGKRISHERALTDWDRRHEIDNGGLPILPFTGANATYEVIQMVYGDYKRDTITFEAYDHYGWPPVLRPKYALLYLIEDSMNNYQTLRYVHNDVYETTNGRWAGPYAKDYTDSYNDDSSIRPEKISFKQRVAYPITITCHDGMIRCFEKLFPHPYFRIENDSAIAVYGNYVEELFKLKRQGILTYFKMFEEPVIHKDRPDAKSHPSDIKFEPYNREPDADKRREAFAPFGKQFLDSLVAGNFAFIEDHLADSLPSDDLMLSKSAFIERNQFRLFNVDFLAEVKKGRTRFYDKIIRCGSTKQNLVKFYINLKFDDTKEGMKLVSYWDDFDPSINEFNPFLNEDQYYYRDTIAN